MKKPIAVTLLVLAFVFGVVGSSFARERVYKYHSGGRRHRAYRTRRAYRRYYSVRHRRYRRHYCPSVYYYRPPRRVYYYYYDYYGPYHWSLGFDCY
jgi:hypothetical protein